MSKQTICSAAIEVLKKSGKPMLASEIYDLIIKDNLYEFKAKEPISMLKSTLRKHTEGVKTSMKSGVAYFKLVENGKYQLLK